MNNPNPATPAQAATPGNGEPVVPNPSAQPGSPEQGNQGHESEGKVTIDLKEYRDLQRAKARTLSFDKRKELRNSNPGQAANGQPEVQGDPALVAENNRLRTENEVAAKRVMQAEVRAGVQQILSKPEFAGLPESTKDLILKNPSMLSTADTVEEALLDIEDYVREHAPAGGGTNGAQQQSGDGGSRQAAPAGHEIPPSVSGGAPAPTNPEGLEDTANLRGSARSTAILRNSLKKQRGVK